MACFSGAYLENFLIGLAVVIGLVMILNLVVPYLLSLTGASPDGGVIIKVLRIVAWVFVMIAIIIFIFELFGCLFGGGGNGIAFPRFGGVR